MRPSQSTRTAGDAGATQKGGYYAAHTGAEQPHEALADTIGHCISHCIVCNYSALSHCSGRNVHRYLSVLESIHTTLRAKFCSTWGSTVCGGVARTGRILLVPCRLGPPRAWAHACRLYIVGVYKHMQALQKTQPVPRLLL